MMWLYEPKVNFLISYQYDDARWAEWIGWSLETSGYTVEYSSWLYPPGDPYHYFEWASQEADRVLLVTSPRLLDRPRFVIEDWPAEVGRLWAAISLVIVEECDWHEFTYTDSLISLIGLVEREAHHNLCRFVQGLPIIPRQATLLEDLRQTTKRAPYPRTGGEASSKKWDVFLVYAEEDSDEVGLPLAEHLGRTARLRVGLAGDGTLISLEEGIARSHCTVVIVSNQLLGSDWPGGQIWDAIRLQRSRSDVTVLPVLHRLDVHKAATFTPYRADDLALATSQGFGHLVKAVKVVVRGSFRALGLLGPDGRPLLPDSEAAKSIRGLRHSRELGPEF